MRAKLVKEGLFSGKKIPSADNEKILKIIYDDFDLKYHEGDYKPNTWIRRGDLLPSEDRNDEVITDFAGIGISYDTITKDYTLSIPVKFKSGFKNGIEKLLADSGYNILSSKDTGYTRVIKFN